jgi:PAS domain S-box-containing protein
LTESRRILNVNDDAAARYLVTRLLRHAGYDVEEAGTGTEALARARALPSLVVLDVKLPDISGLEVCRRLKSDPLTAGIPVLHTSATFTSSEGRVEGLESGADGYLTQPIEPPELLATVRALLRAHDAERVNRELASEWRQTFDAIGDAVALVDSRGSIRRCNRRMQQLTAQDACALTGAPVEAMLHASPGIVVDGLISAAREARARQSLELAAGDRWFRVVADPALDNGDIDRLVVIVTDVTDLKCLEEEQRRRAEQLAQDNRRKDEFLAMLAHELRNPLNAIAASNSLQQHLGAQDSRNVQLRDTVGRHVRKLARMLDELLELSRMTRGTLRLQTRPLDLSLVVDNAVQITSAQTEALHQRVEIAGHQGPLPVAADALRLEQALANIVENASKYSDPETTITIEMRSVVTDRGPMAEVVVRDQGIGLSGEQIESVFQPFVQGPQTLARTSGGLGMGLTIARQLLELHGGTLTADSAGPGAGASFTLRLPLAETASPAAAPDPGGADIGQGDTPLNILIVEDDVDAATMLSTLLESRGHIVRVTNDGLAGVQAARTDPPHVAFVDVGLPGLDGYGVAERLRAGLGEEPLLVALTGYGRPEDRARAIRAGFDVHMVKPIDFDGILSLLRRRARTLRTRTPRELA